MEEQTEEQPTSQPEVIVIKKKKKYSKRLKEVQKSEDFLLQASERAINAIALGLKEYRKKRKKSSRKRKDGAVVDFIPNLGSGISKFCLESAKIPGDFVKITNSKRQRRFIKRIIRAYS